MALRLRRGTEPQRQTITPVEGELLFTTDSKRLYVGDGTTIGGNGVSAPVSSVNGQVGAVNLTSDALPEGSANFYYTTERAQDDAAKLLLGSSFTDNTIHSNIAFTYDDTTGRLAAVVSSPYTNEDAQDAAAGALTAGVHDGISFTYGTTQDGANRIDATVTKHIIDTFIPSPNIYISSFTRGSGYTRNPVVTFTRDVGDTTGDFTNGNVVAFLNSVAVESIQIVNPGSGYLSAPTITIVADPLDPSYANATASCTVSGGQIQSVTMLFEGSFTRCPTVTVTPTNGGAGAVLRAFLYPTNIARFEVVAPGTGWSQPPIVVITPGTGDYPSLTATAISGISPKLVANTPNDTIDLVAGSDRILIKTAYPGGVKKLTIDARDTGEIGGSVQGAIPYYGITGNALVGARGLNYSDTLGTLQVGSDIQNVDGTIRVLRNSFSSTAQLLSTEQYHETANSVTTIGLSRARGTQNTPLIVQTGDKLGSLIFAGHDGTRFVGSAQMAARAVGTIVPGSNKLPTDLEFFTSNGVEAVASRGLVLNGIDKKATFYGPIHVHRLTSTQRDALTGLGANTVGYMIYNTTTNKFQGYQNTGGTTLEWVDLS